jgi:hypothetical protein
MINPEAIDLNSLPWLPLEARSAFPRQPAIYFAINRDGEVQYIGISQDPKRRWAQHHRYEDLQESKGVKIAYLFVEDVALLRPIESALIAWFRPPLNVVGVSGCDFPPNCNFGVRRVKGIPVYRDEKKSDRKVSLTPTCWEKLGQFAAKLHESGEIPAASRSEAIEWLARQEF